MHHWRQVASVVGESCKLGQECFVIDAPHIYTQSDTSAYCDVGPTASGFSSTSHIQGSSVAASNTLPFGTRFRLVGKQTGPDGQRKYIVRDTGSSIMHLDLWTPSKALALKFGRRPVRYVLGWKKPTFHGYRTLQRRVGW